MSENNNGANTNTYGGAEIQEKKTLKQRGHEFAAKHPKAVKRARRIGTAIGFVCTAVGGFLAGKKSVKPTYIEVRPIEPEEEPAQTADEPADETVEE